MLDTVKTKAKEYASAALEKARGWVADHKQLTWAFGIGFILGVFLAY